MTYLEILAEISSRVKDYSYNQLYCGITSDIDSRVHGDHKVPEKGDTFLAVLADSNKIARDAEDYFHKKGMKGDSGGGDSNTRYVYVYHITSSTNP